MTSRLATAAIAAFGSLKVQEASPRHIGKLAAQNGQFLEVSGFPYPLGTAARIEGIDGSAVQGEVVGFRGSHSIVQPLTGHRAMSVGARAIADGRKDMVACGNGLLGRVLGAMGEPLDGRRLDNCPNSWPLTGAHNNPLNRGRVVQPIGTGVRAIDGLLTLGVGQRTAIIAGSGVGKSVLMGQILNGIEADIIVVGMIGERAREVSDFVETKLNGALTEKSVVVAVTADQSPLLRLRGAARATAIAEYFAAQGKSVLLLIDSLTRVAHAQREIGLALGEPPTMKGYTPSSLALIPQLVERAGVNALTGGSITALYTVLADGGDLDDPVVDAARAIVDGHIILSRSMAESGVFPAIDIGRSLSRLMPDIVDDAHLDAASQYRRLWSSYEQNRDLVMMGAYATGNDAVLDEAIARHNDMLDFIKQPRGTNSGFAEACDLLIEGFGK
jgi:flagellum-specific ATP synthase